jgi:hypothetical protein
MRLIENDDYLDYSGLMSEVAFALLGEPTSKHHGGLEWRYGTYGSLSIDLQKNVYYDHEAGQGGGVLDLIIRENGRGPQRCGRMAPCQGHADHVERDEKWANL